MQNGAVILLMETCPGLNIIVPGFHLIAAVELTITHSSIHKNKKDNDDRHHLFHLSLKFFHEFRRQKITKYILKGIYQAMRLRVRFLMCIFSYRFGKNRLFVYVSVDHCRTHSMLFALVPTSSVSVVVRLDHPKSKHAQVQ